jgi:predicted nucleotidyltransferase
VIDERIDLVDAIVYGDVFDCAVTFDEVWRYCRRPIRREELRQVLDEDPAVGGIVVECDGLYCLAGRAGLVERRRETQRRAARLQHRAARVARILRHAPFVRGLLLTGSAAADAASPKADVDLLVIVAEGRLALAFALYGTLSRVVSKKVFCPNHYLSEAHLELVRRRDLYVAREVVQARPLAGRAPDFLSANAWVRELLPNAPREPGVPLPGGGRLQRLLELPFRGRLGDRLERRLHRLALARLAAHHRLWGRPVPDEGVEQLHRGIELRFHAEPGTQSVPLRYEARRDEVAAEFEQAAQPT